MAGFTAAQLEEMGLHAANKRQPLDLTQKMQSHQRRTSNEHIDVYGRVGPRVRASTPTRAQEMDLLREKMEWRLCSHGSASSTKRINAVFADYDACVAGREWHVQPSGLATGLTHG